ncbi:hypothetical protein [Paenibacillus contaminans]|uniref:DUF4367 domain-containing protein n=1 Tax=Paenibacillus contaminans TaxID=450362 RepID=A0A329MGR2_9BACL|nr:hypothetical protein [Paenibacillus contaminans]RAV19099.1 hypothetical protein DQG23_21390 [Paenibacillus contaminans]
MKILHVICFLIYILSANKVYALGDNNLPRDESPAFEEAYFQIGYKSVEEALKECEKHFGRVLELPFKLPPVEFTHHFGRFNNDPNNLNDGFEMEYLHEKQSINHYMLNVRPVQQKINFSKPKRIIKTYKLKDGSEAIYFNTKHSTTDSSWFNILVFEKNGWQYILSVDNRIENSVPDKVLVKIAESVR